LNGQTNATLTLTNVQLANAGWYSVTITNLFGTTNSLFASLTVSSNSNSELMGWAAVAGYGQATTTGGGTNTPIVVTDIATLRTLAGDSTPRVLHLSGTFVTGSSAITIANNKTLRGVDANVVIQGGIDINTKSNIIIQNLSIQANGFGASPVDAAAARTTHHLWFDHVTFSDAGDGLLDLTVGSDFITVSWCKFFYTDPNNTHRLCSLVGNGSTSTTDTNKNNVTYHHNWFSDLVDQRMPRLLFGKGHIFNNYYNAPGNGYCIGTGSWGSALVENNYFKQVNSPHQSQDGNPSYIAASGNVYDSCTGNQQTGLLNPDNDGNDPGPWTPPYSYTLDAAASVPASVISGAGPQ
jgi:pectate lyase